MAKKLHVEIGIDGEKSISRIEGSGGDLIAAAAFAVNAFYRAFAKKSEEDARDFKFLMQKIVAEDDSVIWSKTI